jgi:hypothetical protein
VEDPTLKHVCLLWNPLTLEGTAAIAVELRITRLFTTPELRSKNIPAFPAARCPIAIDMAGARRAQRARG